MVRSFVYLLLLIVVFLTGMLLGIDRDRDMVSSPEASESMPAASASDFGTDDDSSFDESNQVEVANQIEPKAHFTQKAASFLEGGVKGFYEVVVKIFYQTSRFFF